MGVISIRLWQILILPFGLTRRTRRLIECGERSTDYWGRPTSRFWTLPSPFVLIQVTPEAINYVAPRTLLKRTMPKQSPIAQRQFDSIRMTRKRFALGVWHIIQSRIS